MARIISGAHLSRGLAVIGVTALLAACAPTPQRMTTTEETTTYSRPPAMMSGSSMTSMSPADSTSMSPSMSTTTEERRLRP
jgi:uncharacterized lipoprotein YajG